jgi:hypothetical protein
MTGAFWEIFDNFHIFSTNALRAIDSVINNFFQEVSLMTWESGIPSEDLNQQGKKLNEQKIQSESDASTGLNRIFIKSPLCMIRFL